MNRGQFLGHSFFSVCLVCLWVPVSLKWPKMALRLIILDEINDKRCESPPFSMLRLLWDQFCSKLVGIHVQPGGALLPSISG